MKRYELDVERLVIKRSGTYHKAVVIKKHIHVYADTEEQAKLKVVNMGYKLCNN